MRDWHSPLTSGISSNVTGWVLLQVDGVGRIQLSKTVYNFTHMQDIQGIIGYKAHCNQKGKVILVCSPAALPGALILHGVHSAASALLC